MLTLLAALALQDAWWDAAWKLRRSLAVRNAAADAVAAGLPVELEIDPDFLGLRDKARPGLADLAVVRAGRRLPHVLRPSADGRRYALAFPLAEAIPPGKTDAYALYYGNPGGAPPAGAAFPLAEDFARPPALALGGLLAGVQDGAFEIRNVPAGANALVPERVDVPSGPIPPAFTLSFDLEAGVAGAPCLAVCIEVALDRPAAAAEDVKRAEALVRDLGADEFDVRDKATTALVALGEAALPALREAARSEDAEIRTRAQHALAAIRKKTPPPLVRAGLLGGDILWRTASVGGAQSSQGASRSADGSPRRFRFQIERDPEGHVTVLCDGQRLQRGRLEGAGGRVSIAAWKLQDAKPAPMRLDNLFLRPYLAAEDRPATTIDVEETRPQ